MNSIVTSPELVPKWNAARFAPVNVTGAVNLANGASPMDASFVIARSYASTEACADDTQTVNTTAASRGIQQVTQRATKERSKKRSFIWWGTQINLTKAPPA